MALSHGRFTAVMPGPTVIPERVLNAMHRAPPNIYCQENIDWDDNLKRDLCIVARTKQHVVMYVGNGHAAWEATIQNLVNVGDMVLKPSIVEVVVTMLCHRSMELICPPMGPETEMPCTWYMHSPGSHW